MLSIVCQIYTNNIMMNYNVRFLSNCIDYSNTYLMLHYFCGLLKIQFEFNMVQNYEHIRFQNNFSSDFLPVGLNTNHWFCVPVNNFISLVQTAQPTGKCPYVPMGFKYQVTPPTITRKNSYYIFKAISYNNIIILLLSSYSYIVRIMMLLQTTTYTLFVDHTVYTIFCYDQIYPE